MGESKAERYITGSGGKISTVIWIDVQYRDGEWATVSLLVAGSQPGSVRWVFRQKTFHDDKLGRDQPTGEIGLYASDFLTRAGLPLALCRPTDEEIEAGLSRPAYVPPPFFFLSFICILWSCSSSPIPSLPLPSYHTSPCFNATLFPVPHYGR